MADKEETTIAWRDWSNAVPVTVEQRDKWAREAIANPTFILTQSGDSAVIRVDGEMGDCTILDVLVRRTVNFRPVVVSGDSSNV